MIHFQCGGVSRETLQVVIVHSPPNGKLLGEQAPRPSTAEQVKDRIEHLTHIGRAGHPAGLGGRN